MTDMWDERNLPFQAGTAAAYGMSKQDALQTITSNPAKVLGIDDQLGTIEPGKDATLIISKGDLLDYKSSQIIHAFVRGRKVDLSNRQLELYQKFRDKYPK